MEIKSMLITGDQFFFKRHAPLFEALSMSYEHLNYLPGDEPFKQEILNKIYKILNKIIKKNSYTFIARSRQMERRIHRLKEKPDYVLHIFSMYCPFWENYDIPYGMYLDYTMSLAHRNWSPWAPFSNLQKLQAWMANECLAYKRAHHLFAMSAVVKTSLIEDYGISSEKITVVGSFANRHTVYEGEKPFGSQQILFNGYDFERKGGDIVLAAFAQVKQMMPESKLVIIGRKLAIAQDGVENPGRIGSVEEMRQLFLQTDLVVAPGRCDPFPSFVIEAMNYGVPCIVSDNDGMPEIVDHGMNGVVVKPLTPDNLAREILHLLSNISKLTMMSKKAREKVFEKLNRTKVAENMVQSLININPNNE
jgi:glycosyltransferase involved in cell wall biosynthesis